MFTRIRNFVRSIQVAYWSFRFQQHCSVFGNGLKVLGPCVVYGAGKLEVGENLVIRSRPHHKVEIFVAPNATLIIGNNVFINQGVRIVCSKNIQIADHCLIGDESVLLDNDYHGVGSSAAKSAPINLAARVWLGTRVIVLRGVTIGEKSVIGAGSVVTKSIPPNVLAVGSPARPVKTIHEE